MCMHGYIRIYHIDFNVCMHCVHACEYIYTSVSLHVYMVWHANQGTCTRAFSSRMMFDRWLCTACTRVYIYICTVSFSHPSRSLSFFLVYALFISLDRVCSSSSVFDRSVSRTHACMHAYVRCTRITLWAPCMSSTHILLPSSLLLPSAGSDIWGRHHCILPRRHLSSTCPSAAGQR